MCGEGRRDEVGRKSGQIIRLYYLEKPGRCNFHLKWLLILKQIRPMVSGGYRELISLVMKAELMGLILPGFPKEYVWRAGYTPADRQTSWGVLHHTAQYLYSACI